VGERRYVAVGVTRYYNISGVGKYLREGILKQTTEDLRAVQAWIDELRQYRQGVSSDEVEADDGPQIGASISMP
jgi:hypothetical protein